MKVTVGDSFKLLLLLLYVWRQESAITFSFLFFFNVWEQEFENSCGIQSV